MRRVAAGFGHARPGEPAQHVHRAQWAFDFFPFPNGFDVECHTMWAMNDFTEENGQLTPKLSIKRNVILDERSGDIDALYAEAKADREKAAQH